ncbi:hypothetical protein P5G65_23380 [Paenibacillus chondroitinus]|uniref:SRPBCC family protein n=1 Tax=Paenibacillus chondroitinus TaxID=59842 RepID=A0ABU6DGG7_9BACL|nr:MULTISPECIES: hypothetical protein [Paenibacillus]MCY9659454.1 hypothetical protein [Paenibacillus anseongense]MEB4796849.1 hypothetical protein [Paenibacillus chondroitinus]
MITYKDTVFIQSSAFEIINWFLQMDEKQYMAWHKDHKAFRLVSGIQGQVGQTCYSEEYLGSFLLKSTYKLTLLSENRLLRFELGFPYSLLKGTCDFEFEEQSNGTVMTALIKIGGKFDFFDTVVKKAINKLLFKDDLLLSHMRDEGQYLSRIFAETHKSIE